MIQADTINKVRGYVGDCRKQQLSLAFVPTMGNLHDGHLALVKKAKSLADKVVVSIFVNPMQFGAGEDLDNYPRTLTEDCDKLSETGVDCVFLPTPEIIYPEGLDQQTVVHVPGMTDIFCGASRPGHFDGVTTVVSKLFNIVQADYAVFGEKDFQQLSIIRKMVKDLAFPIEIVSVPTIREASGLAMSSRNGYLSAEEKSQARHLYQNLNNTAKALQDGRSDFQQLEKEAIEKLQALGFNVDYFSIVRPDTLSSPTADDRELIILAAAYFGKPRLIDNLQVSR